LAELLRRLAVAPVCSWAGLLRPETASVSRLNCPRVLIGQQTHFALPPKLHKKEVQTGKQVFSAT